MYYINAYLKTTWKIDHMFTFQHQGISFVLQFMLFNNMSWKHFWIFSWHIQSWFL